MQITVQDVMTLSPPTIPVEATIEDVLETLVAAGIPSVYVTTPENRLAGIVTDYDVLKHQVLGADRQITAERLMCRSVPTVRPDASALSVCPQFRDGHMARMAVVDAEGRLVGNLSRCDLMRMMRATGRPAPNEAAGLAVGNTERHDPPGPLPIPRTAQLGRLQPAAQGARQPA